MALHTARNSALANLASGPRRETDAREKIGKRVEYDLHYLELVALFGSPHPPDDADRVEHGKECVLTCNPSEDGDDDDRCCWIEAFRLPRRREPTTLH